MSLEALGLWECEIVSVSNPQNSQLLKRGVDEFTEEFFFICVHASICIDNLERNKKKWTSYSFFPCSTKKLFPELKPPELDYAIC